MLWAAVVAMSVVWLIFAGLVLVDDWRERARNGRNR